MAHDVEARLGADDDSLRAAGDSAEQRECEELIIRIVGQTIGCELTKCRMALPNGGWLEIDGCDAHPNVLCEAWAHQGRVRPAQKYKVITDAGKLFLAGRILGTSPRKIIAFADDIPAQ